MVAQDQHAEHRGEQHFARRACSSDAHRRTALQAGGEDDHAHHGEGPDAPRHRLLRHHGQALTVREHPGTDAGRRQCHPGQGAQLGCARRSFPTDEPSGDRDRRHSRQEQQLEGHARAGRLARRGGRGQQGQADDQPDERPPARSAEPLVQDQPRQQGGQSGVGGGDGLHQEQGQRSQRGDGEQQAEGVEGDAEDEDALLGQLHQQP